MKRSSPRVRALAAGITLGGLVSMLSPRAAEAHLIAPSQATVHVVDMASFAVVSVPVAALPGVDDDGDGRLSGAELDRHRDAVEAEVARRFKVTSPDGLEGATVRVDLVLSPDHGSVDDRATTIVALQHVVFGRPMRAVDVATDLFDPRDPDAKLTVSVRHGVERETEAATLTPASSHHAFLGASPSAAGVGTLPSPTRASWTLAVVALVAAIALGALGTLGSRRGRTLKRAVVTTP